MERIKYPRTPHLSWSKGATSDDKKLKNDLAFIGQRVIVTEKMDGENTTMTRDYMHARSVDSGYHSSRNYLKQFHAGIRHLLPLGWRICGENMYARHSIAYDDLEHYFLGFSVWANGNLCLSWDDTVAVFNEIGIAHVPVIWEGEFDKSTIHSAFCNYERQQNREVEGYVIRSANSFDYEDFGMSVAKYVRENHVQTDEHWSRAPVIANGLKK